MTPSIQNLQEIIDPNFRYLFLDDRGFTEAFMISGLEKNNFLIHHPISPLQDQTREGFFIASNGKGIVRFKGACEHLPNKGVELSLYRIQVDLKEINLVNRREFMRHHLRDRVPVIFDYNKRKITASLVNISEGGMRLSVEERLPLNIIFHFEINLSILKDNFRFKSDGLIIYSEPEDNPDEFMTGIAFIAPHFFDESEKKAYTEAREELKALTCLNNH